MYVWKSSNYAFLLPWQHDNQAGCLDYNLKSEPREGFYLMHSIAQNGRKINNRKFSPCSVDKMGAILSQEKRVMCFKGRWSFICWTTNAQVTFGCFWNDIFLGGFKTNWRNCLLFGVVGWYLNCGCYKIAWIQTSIASEALNCLVFCWSPKFENSWFVKALTTEIVVLLTHFWLSFIYL